MKTYRVEPTDKALVDAGEAYFWISEQSEVIALRWYEGLLKAFRSLEKTPHQDETVFVLRVRHSTRQYLRPEDEEDGEE